MLILAPLGWIYGRVMQARNALYDWGILKCYDLGARTISVGNITTGGTGKTPLVALIANILAEHGEKVCILTRGYGRKDENKRVVVCSRDTMVADAELAGDEPVELAQQLLGRAIIIADADRVAAANWAKDNFGITTFVLDDGYQHRRAKRDLDIVCIDATDPFGKGRVLPAGRLREPVANLKRASAIVITRVSLVNSDDEILKKVTAIAPDALIFRCDFRIKEFRPLEATPERAEFDPDEKAFAFCALGNPKNFFETLRRAGVNLAGELCFPDHHKYNHEDVSAIENAAKSAGASRLITTAKDAVKLQNLQFSLPCFVGVIETVIDDPVRFRELVISV